MSDERPAPRYGEYAPGAPRVEDPPLPPPTPVEPEPEPKPRYNTRDLIITTALLLVGVWDVASRWQEYLGFGSVLAEAFAFQGLDEFTSYDEAAAVGLWMNISRAAILVITIVVSLILISRGRIAFWVPLVGGALAIIVLLVLSASVMVNDPAFVDFVGRTVQQN
ncbi:hypothetical protein M2152_000531 [Microbacteriaceae bacterium SG_E_30_P1]|uniref:Uncharacterized protein n=1 Tax=Antiquaquibacter oligotrophicus TaxID=2880260 RepID=A0ABT6KKH0_9MICO|nr:DUF6264 family protein [Antiquaquibacter oligotrophicus]MDH6180349.1 hypothetical protein [Antiquaquibacter oligotrophicus]UDF13909.1 DUF6264 family protein [Antiquaquibacter oligotrophicus]